MKNDLISRADALALIEYMGPAFHAPTIREALARIKGLPAADAEQVVCWEGHCDEDLNRGDWRICTACGHDEWGKAEDGSNYCPACGARMDADAPERAGKDGRDG